jgi:hypothetical protein
MKMRMTANENVMEPGINGFLVEPGNVHELYLTMKEIIGNPDNTLKLCASSLNYANQNTWSINLAPFIGIVERVNAKNNPPKSNKSLQRMVIHRR